jgi:D-hydroxyproline dehydrogenase subunit gamma
MSDGIMLKVNGSPVTVAPGTSVAAAMMIAVSACRTSVKGEPRSALCGMGICFECRVVINGRLHCRGCQVFCEPGMDVRTDG